MVKQNYIDFQSNTKTLKIYPFKKDFQSSLNLTPQNLKTIQQQIQSHDILYLIENFELICCYLRPLLITWDRRPSDSPINASLVDVFTIIGEKALQIVDYIGIILPQYWPFLKFAQQKSHIKKIGRVSYRKVSNYDFEAQDHLKNFLYYLQNERTDKSLQIDKKLANDKTMSAIETKLKQYFNQKRQKQKVKLSNIEMNETEVKDSKEQISIQCQTINNYINKLSQGQIIQSNRQCLNCSRFFYQKGKFSYDCSHSFYQIDALTLIQPNKINQLQGKLKSYVCSFLNTQQGGLLLLGCNRVGTGIQTVGIQMTQKQKQSLQQRVQQYMKALNPSIKRNKQLFIDFVPIFKHPGASGTQKPIQGLYVVRIKIFPSKLPQFYYHQLKSSDYYYAQKWKNGVNQQLKSDDWYNIIQQKYRKYHDINSTIQKVKALKRKIVQCHYSLQCDMPEKGLQFTQEDRQKQVKPESQTQEQQQKKVKQSSEQPQIYEHKGTKSISESHTYKKQQLKFRTIVIVKKYEDMVQLNNLCKKNIQGFIIQKLFFQTLQKFTNYKKTCVVYHKCSYQKLKGIAKQVPHIHLINVLKYLQIKYKPHAIPLCQLEQIWLKFENQLKINVPNGKIQIKFIITDDIRIKDKNKKKDNLQEELVEFNNLEAALFGYFYIKQQFIHVHQLRFTRGSTLVKNYKDKQMYSGKKNEVKVEQAMNYGNNDYTNLQGYNTNYEMDYNNTTMPQYNYYYSQEQYYQPQQQYYQPQQQYYQPQQQYYPQQYYQPTGHQQQQQNYYNYQNNQHIAYNQSGYNPQQQQYFQQQENKTQDGKTKYK